MKTLRRKFYINAAWICAKTLNALPYLLLPLMVLCHIVALPHLAFSRWIHSKPNEVGKDGSLSA